MKIYTFIIALTLSTVGFAQKGQIKGTTTSDNEKLEFVSIYIEENKKGAVSDMNGNYSIDELEYGNYTLIASYVGFQMEKRTVSLNPNHPTLIVDFDLKETSLTLDQVVVTATKTPKRKIDSPVIVNVVSSQTLNNVQACNLSEGLKFQPGLRVETDCQTCNYTQLRMNGLPGGYSQILINGRPIFSPLTGLYGMEQIPANMIERIETVRGGGSSLYGSGAVGGTVNIITKIPKESAYELGYTYQSINGITNDKILSGNATALTHKNNAGASFFVNNRNREAYDHNNDNFSELPQLKNNSFGTNLFLLPTQNQKIELSLSSLNEYRYGGELVDKPAHLAQQSEERTHDVFMSSIDYQINFNEDNSSFIAYGAYQKTDRKHYTGTIPDPSDTIAFQEHFNNPPYGFSDNSTVQGGLQFNHKLKNFLGGKNIITTGGEYIEDAIIDIIEVYNYNVNQITKNYGLFFQSDWDITPRLNFLAGIRGDNHNMVDKTAILSPRLSVLYKIGKTTQLRAGWSTGFRAPQAFDTDLHIAFAGGGISRVVLDTDLKEERSQSFTSSINFDLAKENYVYGFTVEGFYTNLSDAFILEELSDVDKGNKKLPITQTIFEKRNSDGAIVSGITTEVRLNYNRKLQIEGGYTIQKSEFKTMVEAIENLPAQKQFLRTPNEYGFTTLTLTPIPRWNTAINMVYTGEMILAHFAGAPEQTSDQFKVSNSFYELDCRTSYTFNLKNLDAQLELFGGIKNILNAYQNDFDTGKNRDSNYIYGPGVPRTYFAGIKLKSL